MTDVFATYTVVSADRLSSKIDRELCLIILTPPFSSPSTLKIASPYWFCCPSVHTNFAFSKLAESFSHIHWRIFVDSLKGR